ncbi:DUF924 family protein [Maricaulaceae bacterium MS644]
MSRPPDPESVLEFWFERAGPKRWFSVDPVFDAEMRRRFGPACHALRRLSTVAGHPWLVEPDSALALLILTDQAPRNVWRGSNAAFSLDPLARQAAAEMLAGGFDWALAEDRRAFVYMPLMHSEDLEDQALCVALCEERLGADSGTAGHARAHRELIIRFGRFPHRNEALGRASTAAEIEFLSGGGYAPGAKRPAKSS